MRALVKSIPPIAWTLIAVVVVPVCLFGWMAVRESHAQQHNRDACARLGGSYLQAGDKYFSGLCARPDGLLWNKGVALEISAPNPRREP